MPMSPIARLKQIVVELEVWNFLLDQLPDQIYTLAISQLTMPTLVKDTIPRSKRSSYSKIKQKDNWHIKSSLEKSMKSYLENHLELANLCRIKDQFLEEEIFIDSIQDDFWAPFELEIKSCLKLFKFRQNNLEQVIEDIGNFIFVASQLAIHATHNVNNFSSETSNEIDDWEETQVIEFLKNMQIPQSDNVIIQSKLYKINKLQNSATCK